MKIKLTALIIIFSINSVMAQFQFQNGTPFNKDSIEEMFPCWYVIGTLDSVCLSNLEDDTIADEIIKMDKIIDNIIDYYSKDENLKKYKTSLKDAIRKIKLHQETLTIIKLNLDNEATSSPLGQTAYKRDLLKLLMLGLVPLTNI